jgi:hypothetical protein
VDSGGTEGLIVAEIGAVVQGSSPGAPYEYWHNEFLPGSAG